MGELLEPRRAGRPWAALRGASQELNEIATALRTWLDDAGITVAVLHGRLTADHFPDSAVPAQRKLYDFCGGKDLTWAFIEAVADVCTPDDEPAQRRKLERVRPLWEAAHANPTPVEQEARGASRELFEAKDRVIAAYQQIDRLRQAQADSDQARVRAEHLVTLLLSMLGQLFTKIGDLTQDRNRLLAELGPDAAALTAVEDRLQEAKGHRDSTQEALRRAEHERDEALRVADEARRVARRLQDELDRVRAGHNGPNGTSAVTSEEPDGLDTTGTPAAPDPDDMFMRDYAEALRKAQTVLDTGSNVLQAAEERIAEASADLPPNSGNVIPGTVLSRTTPHNPPTSEEAEFEDRYRAYVTQRHGELTIFGMDFGDPRHTRWSLDLSYMSLEVTGAAPGTVERVEQALAGRQRTVVTGDAGSGKTTLLQWLAVNAARQSLPSLLEHLNGSVPFVLPLRSLASRSSFPRPEDLLAAMGCPLAGAQPEGWAHHVFEHGRALVLVDGVDEIAPEQRTLAQRWLEETLAAYPRGCYVVTTRRSAVPLDWLDSVGFRHLVLRPMSAQDVANSIALWHAAARSEADEHEHQALIGLEKSVLDAVRHDQNLTALATTPLLCSMICALNRDRRGVLPRDVMSLYEAALSMLLVRRDAERGIDAVEGIQLTEHESVQLLQTLAYWLLRNNRSETSAATASQLLQPVLAAMPALSYRGDPREVLRHLLIRSGLLREPAVDRVEFIHRGFQDYLSARAAVEAADFGMLGAMATQDRWEDVIRMAIGHARPRERADLLSALVNRGDHEESHREQLHRLSFSCLKYATELDPITLELVRQRDPDRER
ncbi:NACHT domain-containing protein [Streptomyces sp. S07_1.15]|uniref:NACHT domain-containing protein n=1 Tax=Streptomyces sp. S07_1.15 TaxID=2873925 RepID=UPI001D144676|nr:NACHT domain-containing protein [Streptomyces sp. S07_1.15]MCC3655747.1 NACHT domain-containing protein [Streptomyces sp. S07_1.15]